MSSFFEILKNIAYEEYSDSFYVKELNSMEVHTTFFDNLPRDIAPTVAKGLLYYIVEYNQSLKSYKDIKMIEDYSDFFKPIRNTKQTKYKDRKIKKDIKIIEDFKDLLTIAKSRTSSWNNSRDIKSFKNFDDLMRIRKNDPHIVSWNIDWDNNEISIDDGFPIFNAQNLAELIVYSDVLTNKLLYELHNEKFIILAKDYYSKVRKPTNHKIDIFLNLVNKQYDVNATKIDVNDLKRHIPTNLL